MAGIKATSRRSIPLYEVLDCYSVLRGLATNLDGYQTIKVKTNN